MKVFVLLPRVPYPLEKGDKLRAFHFIRLLARKHEVILCALNNEELNPAAIEVLQKYTSHIHVMKQPQRSVLWNIGKAFLDGKPLHLGYFWNLPVFSEIQSLIEQHKPDHIFCQLIRVADYVKHIDIPKTIDYQDVFSAGILRRKELAPFWQKPIFDLEYRRLRQYESDIFPFFNNRMIISEPDRDLIHHSKNKTIDVVPNGVDIDYFKLQPIEKKYDLLFTGNMNYPPNVTCAEVLAKEILPELHKHKPDLNLVIAGASPSAKVLALQSNHVKVTGWVDDLREYYAASRIFVAPLIIGTGLQNKLLEAMAMHLPCITSQLANNALQATENKEILIGHSTADFVKHIIDLLDHPERAELLANNAYQFIQRNYSWDSVGDMIENIIHRK